MKKIYIFILLIPFFGFSQRNTFWKKTDTKKTLQKELINRATSVANYNLYDLELEQLKSVLSGAVSRGSSQTSNTIVKFPNIDGKMERYQIYEASIMEPDFAARHPEIQSYVGINIDNPGVNMRFSTTVFGFHASIYTLEGTVYIDPYTEDLNTYIMYSRKDLLNEEERMLCEFEEAIANTRGNDNFENTNLQRNANDGFLRTFRFALASTQEYSNYHINAAGQQTASDAVKRATVLAAMNVTMMRVNGLYERDLAATMQLIDNTSIIFLAEDDGYTNNDGFAMLAQNQSIIDANIGTANYDVGHVFSTGGGGVASLGGICFSNAKARAVTGLGAPVGDAFDVDFVAHEIGHHFGATQTFNGSQGNCSGANRTASTSVEPGSGTTIMAYAGICGGDNIQSNSDDHFNAISIDQMYDRITGTGSYLGDPTCSVNSVTGNLAPISNAGLDYTIPFGTAFTLSGTGSDPDGGTVTYNWEQVDPGTVAGQPSPTDTDGPMFRSRPSRLDGERTFPQLADILDGNLTPQWEVIPNVARVMDFALTVRDNQTPGQTNRDDMRVTVANTGPFRVTAPDMTNASFPSGSSTTVTWDVAGTTANGINTSNVNILFSQDGGQTFSTLIANTPNDGSQSVTFPSINEPYCRLKIEAVDNIYFAMSKSFSVGATVTTSTTCNTYTTGPISTPIPDGSGNVFIPINVTENNSVEDLRIYTNVTHSWTGDLVIQVQEPNTSTSGLFTNVWNNNCNTARFENIDVTFKDNEPSIVCGTPTVGTYSPANSLNVFDGIDPQGTWNVVFVDSANQDSGTVNEVSIELCTTTTNIVLSNDDFNLNDFSLFPNPNNGNFNLQFNSGSGKDIAVTVYDISGKLVFNNNYDATSRFNKEISLRNVSSGIYIMKVDDGDKSVTRKIIIE